MLKLIQLNTYGAVTVVYFGNRGDRGVTNRKVVGSIPAGASGFFIEIKSFRSHYGPGVDTASNRNEYQEYFLVVNAAGT